MQIVRTNRLCRAMIFAVLSGSLIICFDRTSIAQNDPAPRSFEALAVSPTEIDLYWLPAADADSYKIMRGNVTIAELAGNETHYRDQGLIPGTTHTYTIVAHFPFASPPSLQNNTKLRPFGSARRTGPAFTNYSWSRSYTERTFVAWPASSGRSVPEQTYDVVVAQASSGGVAAAIEAAERGLKVALIEPTTRIGGIPANGLSATDLRRAEHAEGFFVRFRDRVKSLYAAEGVKADGMSYEPRIANQAMKSLLYEQNNITLFRRVRHIGVETHLAPDGNRLVDAIRIEELDAQGKPTGKRARLLAKVFIDSTDCGDIAAWAGAPFRLGREARSAREPHNGMIYYDRANDRPLPGSTGKGDSRIQAYSYLLTVKDYGKGADKTIPVPAGYRKEDFIHTPEWLKSWAITSGTMPGSKMELNQHPQGGDIQGINYRYPLMTWAEREKIDRLHREHVLGYLYYIQTEQGQKQVGLPDDEYRDSGGFPPLLYVREGRRILGDFLPDESYVTEARTHAEPLSVGLGDYPMDSHAVRPKTNWSTPDMGEGEWWLYKQTPVHRLPLGIISAQKLDNVFVTTAVSSTHVSFGTYRLEPVRMALGQAAGIAADICIRTGATSHTVPARQIQDELLPHAANTHPDPAARLSYYTDLNSAAPWYRAVQYLTTRGIGPKGDLFEPHAAVTGAELAGLLTALAARANPGHETDAYLGAPAHHAYLTKLGTELDAGKPITRLDLARVLTRLFPAQVDKKRAAMRPYADTPVADIPGGDIQQEAANLYAMGIDSVLWDGVKAVQPDGKLLFRPGEKLTRCQLFAALYLVQIDLGPLWDDHPADRTGPWSYMAASSAATK